MNSARETQFGCYICFIKKLAGPMNSARDPGKKRKYGWCLLSKLTLQENFVEWYIFYDFG